MERGALKNIDRIEEDDGHGRYRASAFILVAVGGAALVFAAVLLSGKRTSGTTKRPDPLAELVAQRGAPPAPSARATDLGAQEVTFPGLLSDGVHATTVFAAVRGNSAPAPSAGPVGAASAAALAPEGPFAHDGARDDGPAPPPAADRLPVVPLPAQQVLQPSPLVTRPRDTLTKAATEVGQITTPAPPSAAVGHEGGYQLQVSSFRTQGEAQGFADQLRARGHKAYVAEARVQGRGTWYRVRVGPFASQQAATAYRASFEAKEHVVPFVVVPPPKATPAP